MKSLHAERRTQRIAVSKLAVIAGVVAALVLTLWAPQSAFGASPDLCSLSSCPGYIDKSLPPAQQYAQWLALKDTNRIRSGVLPNERKGTPTHPYVGPSVPPSRMPYQGTVQGAIPYSMVFPCQEPGAIYPCSHELVLDNAVPTTWEPGDGAAGYSYNFGWGQNHQGTASYDDAEPYPKTYLDTNFFDLCGPGAADVALYYWPAPANYANYANVMDPQTGVSTTWDGKDPYDQTYRMRGYDVHLAWQIKAPGWTQPGMMEQYAGGGVTLQTEAQAMNWEASGESTQYWQNYFYDVVWWNNSSPSTFYGNVQYDTDDQNVPVVAEVNALKMPNWPNKSGSIHHLITIIGYNDLVHNQDGTYGIYYYTDTCGNSTQCGSNNDGQVNTAPYDTMWNAITNIPVNQNTGDGGYVW